MSVCKAERRKAVVVAVTVMVAVVVVVERSMLGIKSSGRNMGAK